MKKLLILFAFSYLLNTRIHSQDLDYHSIPDEHKILVFEDTFDADSHPNPWELVANKVKGKIKNGEFSLTSKQGSGRLAMVDPGIPFSKNFEIETSVNYVSGESGATLAFGLGKNSIDSYDHYVFYFNKNQIGIGKYENERWSPFRQKNTSYHSGKFNKMTIRKMGSMVQFFFNEELVFSYEITKSYGSQIGIEPPFNGTASFDYLRILEIEN